MTVGAKMLYYRQYDTFLCNQPFHLEGEKNILFSGHFMSSSLQSQGLGKLVLKCSVLILVILTNFLAYTTMEKVNKFKRLIC